MRWPGPGAVTSGPGVAGGDASAGYVEVMLATPLFRPDYSGAAERFERYAPGLLERGVRLRVLAAEVGAWSRSARYSPWDRGGAGGERAETGDGISVQRVPMPDGASKRRVRWNYESALIRMCLDASAKPDVVITLSLLSGISGLRFRRTGVPLIHVQTMFSAPVSRFWTDGVRKLASAIRHRLPDCIVVSSSIMAEDLDRRGVRTRSETIPHGVDLGRFRPPSDSPGAEPIRRTLGFQPEDEVLLFVGPINERKGVDLLAEAWTLVAAARPRARLLLVGPEAITMGEVPDAFGRRVRSRLSGGPGRDRVHFTGSVTNVEEYFRAADLLVFPSRREGMPNVVCEAFASGLASVLTPFLGLPDEFGKGGQTYESVPHDPSEIARRIITLLADDERRWDLGRAARRWAEHHLDVRMSLDQYAALCKELAHVPGSTPVSQHRGIVATDAPDGIAT